MKWLLALAAVVALVTGCGSDPPTGPDQEASVAVFTPEPDWETVKMDNWEYEVSYTRVRHKCDGHGHRVYVREDSDHQTAPFFIVINDKTCPGGVEDNGKDQ